jgi:hypothetical protein
VLNTCDQTLIYLSAAFGVQPGVCAPMIMHPRGGLVSGSSPAAPGETLVLYAYGLGAVNHPIPADCCSIPEQLPLVVQPFVLNFRYPDLNVDAKSRVIAGLHRCTRAWSARVCIRFNLWYRPHLRPCLFAAASRVAI